MAELNIIIKNGTVVTATNTLQTDIGIKDEKIFVIAPNLSDKNAKIIDAADKYVFPGGIDTHTHIDMPLCNTDSATGAIHTTDDFETATIAAAFGGTTSIIDFCNQSKGKTLASTIDTWQEKAAKKAVIDYSFHVMVTDPTEKTLAEIPKLIDKGFPSYKLMMAYKDMRVNDEAILKILAITKEHNGLVCAHAENFHAINYFVEKFKRENKTSIPFHPLSRPPLVEAEAVARLLKLAALIDTHVYVVHVTCKDSLTEIIRAKEAGVKVFAETCPQYLFLSQDNYLEKDAAKFMLTPPLRPKENQEFLWQGLCDGHLLNIATDHCPINFHGMKDQSQKFFEILNGLPGIEARIPLIFDRGVNSKKITLEQFVALTSTNPAKIFGMYPQKGAIMVGADADLVIFDPKLKRTISREILHERVDYTPYEGFEVTGYPIMTLSRGKVIVDKGKFIGKTGAGKFLTRKL
ncbi:MAG: dihydropyrimidinase [Gammaproteobacteria bacterium]|nr:dihydropyrimidinase [Gammaproteobacteria bacterium]